MEELLQKLKTILNALIRLAPPLTREVSRLAAL